MGLQLERRVMLVVHDVLVHPFIGVVKALSPSTKTGWANRLHNITVPPLPIVDRANPPEQES